MEQREERVVLETGRHRITGTLRLPREGYGSRLTDFLNADGREFVALTDVELSPLDGAGAARTLPYLAVSRRHVVIATTAAPDSAVS